MNRMTKKYSAAVHRLNIMGVRQAYEIDSEDAYRKLMDAGYQWDSKVGEWIKVADLPANPANQIIRVRVWAPKGQATEIANVLVEKMRTGFTLVDQSEPYPCRPPKQLEERVYLSFLKWS